MSVLSKLQIGAVAVLALLTGFSVQADPSLSGPEGLVEKFSNGRYEDAREILGTAASTTLTPDEMLMNFLLTSDSQEMSALINSIVSGDPKDNRWQTRLIMERADLAFAQGNYGQVLKVLEPLTQGGAESAPGHVFLFAGLASRALGLFQQAREMLASVKPSDPVYAKARFYLGDIAMEQGDPHLALRYFQNANQSSNRMTSPAASGTMYKALLAVGRQAAADSLLSNHDAGLSWLSVAPPVVTVPAAQVDSVTTRPQGAGKFCLQLGAFRDRALALNFLREHSADIPDLRIAPSTTAKGEKLYRIRCGAFNNPEAARARARDLHDRYHLDVIVKETE